MGQWKLAARRTAAASCAAHLLQSFVNGRAVLCRRSADTTRSVLPWERWAMDAPSVTIHIIFCICSVFTPPCYNQPAVENNRTFKPTELCGLSNVNGAEHAAGLRLPRSRAWPWLSGQPWLLGLRKALGVSFPFHLHWAEPKSVHVTEGGQVGVDVSAAASCVRAPFSLTLTLEPFFLSLIEKAV